MEIEVQKKFKDSDGNERNVGEIINTKEDEHVSEELAKDLVEKDYADELENLEVSMEDAYVQSYTEWWKEIYQNLTEDDSIDLSEESLVDATNQVLSEVGRAKRQDKIDQQRQGGGSESNNSNDTVPASDKQVNYLEGLAENKHTDISVPENPTKSQAHELIDKANSQIPATEDQKNKLDDCNIPYSQDISKKEAGEKLDDFFDKQEG